MRPITLLAAAIVLAIGLGTRVSAQEAGLPELGSSAGEILTPGQETAYGAYTLHELRRLGLVLEDPLIDAWLQGMGHRLAAVSDNPSQPFTFFMLRDREINAFATLGGYVGMNVGLVLTANREDEVAGVLAHEISHVTQRHVLRAVERAKKDQLPIMLVALGAILASQSSNGASADNATGAVVVGAQALMYQRMIDYTRANESEADRIGIQTLHRSGYDIDGMADFFARMQSATRGDSGGYQTPDYLRTHPVTTVRISEARDRAEKLHRENLSKPATTAFSSNNLLLPGGLAITRADNSPAPGKQFEWARERLRVLSARSPAEAIAEYRTLAESLHAQTSDAHRYGLALAHIQAGQTEAAEPVLLELSRKYPQEMWLRLALAEAAHVGQRPALMQARFDELLRQYPENRAISLAYARALNDTASAEAGRRSLSVLRPLLANGSDDPLLQQTYARAAEIAGDLGRAGEAYAESAFLSGRAEDALNQLTALLKRDDLDYIQRARIEARIAAMQPVVLELRRQGIKPQDQG